MPDIDTYAPRTGRMLKENSEAINHADLLATSALEIARGNVSGAHMYGSWFGWMENAA